MARIDSEQRALKQKKNAEIEQVLIREFGPKALVPAGDLDRPFTPTELQTFVRHPLVSMGNHLNNHEILTNYSFAEARQAMIDAQRNLFDMTEITPIAIAYPNGNFSKETLAAAKEVGFKLGITTLGRKNTLPIDCEGDAFLALKRVTLTGSKAVKRQCELLRSDIQSLAVIRKLLGIQVHENRLSY